MKKVKAERLEWVGINSQTRINYTNYATANFGEILTSSSAYSFMIPQNDGTDARGSSKQSVGKQVYRRQNPNA